MSGSREREIGAASSAASVARGSAADAKHPTHSYIMRLPRIRPIHPCPASAGHRIVRLAVPSAALPAEPRAHIAAKGWEVVESFPLEVGYEHWGAGACASSGGERDARLMRERADVVLAHLLPHGLPEGTPTAFTQVGHIGEAPAPLSPHSLQLTLLDFSASEPARRVHSLPLHHRAGFARRACPALLSPWAL